MTRWQHRLTLIYNRLLLVFGQPGAHLVVLRILFFNKIIDNYKNELLIIGVSVDKSKEAYNAYVSENMLKFQTVLNNPKKLQRNLMIF